MVRLSERALLWRVRGPGLFPGSGIWLQCGQKVLGTTETRVEENMQHLYQRLRDQRVGRHRTLTVGVKNL